MGWMEKRDGAGGGRTGGNEDDEEPEGREVAFCPLNKMNLISQERKMIGGRKGKGWAERERIRGMRMDGRGEKSDQNEGKDDDRRRGGNEKEEKDRLVEKKDPVENMEGGGGN